MKFTQLQCKEVICICDGRRLGYVSDVEVEVPEGKISALIVPGPCRFPCFWNRKDDFCIPWRCVCRVGPDIILVDVRPEECRIPRKKAGWL